MKILCILICFDNAQSSAAPQRRVILEWGYNLYVGIISPLRTRATFARYTNKGVYLRELLSNSMDALEKARFLSIQDQDFLGDYPDLEVRVEVDPVAKTLSLQDSGVGAHRAKCSAVRRGLKNGSREKTLGANARYGNGTF